MDIAELTDSIVERMWERGLVLVTKKVAEHGLDFEAKQKKLMQQKGVSLYNAAKFKLIDGATSYETLKNMIRDGRIKEGYLYHNKKGTQMVLTYGIRLMNKETV